MKMKVGVNLKIDVSKLDKSRFFRGQKGIYADITAFIDLDQEDQYGNSGFLTQSMSADERQAGVQMPIIGNSKIFYKNSQQSYQAPRQAQQPPQQQPAQYSQPAQQPMHQAPQQPSTPSPASSELEDDIPF